MSLKFISKGAFSFILNETFSLLSQDCTRPFTFYVQSLLSALSIGLSLQSFLTSGAFCQFVSVIKANLSSFHCEDLNLSASFGLATQIYVYCSERHLSWAFRMLSSQCDKQIKQIKHLTHHWESFIRGEFNKDLDSKEGATALFFLFLRSLNSELVQIGDGEIVITPWNQ